MIIRYSAQGQKYLVLHRVVHMLGHVDFSLKVGAKG